jgi:IPT/TIG domain-containing protein
MFVNSRPVMYRTVSSGLWPPSQGVSRRARGALLAAMCSLAWVLASCAAALGTPPAVTAIAPNNGPAAGGTSVAITGNGFLAGSTVQFGSSTATGVSVNSSTSITATSPAGSGMVDVHVSNANGISEAVPSDQFGYDPAPSRNWLGLDGNGSTFLGPVSTFEQLGVVYDRSGPLDFPAGRLPAEGDRLEADMNDGMIPVVTIEYRGYKGRFKSDPKFPFEPGSRKLKRYVTGFIKTATAMMETYPGRTILFEPMNEPWGYTTPQYNGAAYGNVLAALLPAAARAHIPLSSIYVAGFGKHWVQQMYASQPQLQREIQGWYFHPYGPASGSTEENSRGIQSLPSVQAEMSSGQNNIIVSEVGYCAGDVNNGSGCPNPVTSAQAASSLTQMLTNARPYHQAGWLRALLIYSRNDGGWAMQLSGGAFTKQGEALKAFAKSSG